MDARREVRRTGKVLVIYARSEEVPQLRWGAHGTHKKRYEVFRVEKAHGRFPQPARTIMEAQRQCLGLVRRFPWPTPVSCRGAHIEAFVNGRKGYQSKGPHHLSSDSWQNRKLCHTCKQCMPNEEKEKMYDTLAAESQW